MYLSSKKHILSNTLILATLIQFAAVILQMVILFFLLGEEAADGMPATVQKSSTFFSGMVRSFFPRGQNCSAATVWETGA